LIKSGSVKKMHALFNNFASFIQLVIVGANILSGSYWSVRQTATFTFSD